jgi:PAS domain S-box-containing protein
MSIRVIVLALVLIVTLLFSVIFFLIFQTTMPKMLLEAENKFLQQQIHVVEGLFYDAIKHTYVLAEDTAFWDESVGFVTGKNPDYFKNNWKEGSLLENFSLDFIVYADRLGRTVHAEFANYPAQQPLLPPKSFITYAGSLSRRVIKKYSETKSLFEDKVTTDNVVKGYLENAVGFSGIMFFSGKAYIMACAPIASDRSDEQASGTIIFGKTLSNEYFRELTHYSTSSFELLDQQDGASDSAIHLVSETRVSTEISLRDIEGDNVLLRMSDLRSIYTQGKTTLTNSNILLFVMMLAFAFVIYWSVRRLALKPLESLSNDLNRLKESEALPAEKYSKTREFNILCAAINSMLEHLNHSQISMDVFQNILNGTEAYIYVTDPLTDEVLFVNHFLLKALGITGDYKGKTCWKILHKHKTQRCDFCPLPKLQTKPDSTVVWEHFYPNSKRYFRHTDCLIRWPGRDNVHLQNSIDITYMKNTSATLERRLEQQRLMSVMSQSFISAEDTSTLINKALSLVGEFMTCSRILVLHINEDSRTLEFAYDWRNPRFENIKPAASSWLFKEGTAEYDAFITQKNAYMAIDDTPGIDCLNLTGKHKVRAFIHIPIFVDNSFWGLLSFTELDQAREWSESDVQLAKLIGSIISAAITRGAMEDNLLRMSDIVNSSPQFIAYINKDGKFDYFNQGVLDISGYSAHDLKNGGLVQIFDEQTYRIVRGEIIPRVLRGVETDFELYITKKDGSNRLMAFSAFKTASKDAGIGTIATDITAQRAMEKELIAARDQAELSSHAKGNFLARMSHEMRTPMNAIIGMTNIAKASGELEKKEYCLDKIDQASKHLLGVINDILDMSKIEAGKFELSFTEFSFEKMLTRVINVINFRVEEKKQKFIVNVDRDMPPVVVSDEQRLAQVITNLLSNAVKFTPEEGSITLDVKVLGKENNKYNVQVGVTDTGIGISREQQTKLFHSFEQADGGIARKYGGTGLGLAISKSIIDMMHGNIWIESVLGKGASFIFNIACLAPEQLAASAPEAASAGIMRPAEVKGCFKDAVILLAEDLPINSEIVVTLLEDTEIAIDCAMNGLEALTMFRDHPGHYDLILMDIHMPEVDGYEATRRIRSLGTAEAETIPIVAMTANVFREDIEKCLSCGMNDHIGKPVDMDELMSKVPQPN